MLSASIVVPASLGSMIRKLRETQPKVPGLISAAVRSSALAVVAEAKRTVPVSTGALRDSINATFFENGFAAIIGSYLPYAAKWEYSVVDHPVKPVQRRTRETSSGHKGTVIKGTGQFNPEATWGFTRKALAKEKPVFLLKLLDIVRRFK